MTLFAEDLVEPKAASFVLALMYQNTANFVIPVPDRPGGWTATTDIRNAVRYEDGTDMTQALAWISSLQHVPQSSYDSLRKIGLDERCWDVIEANGRAPIETNLTLDEATHIATRHIATNTAVPRRLRFS